MGSASGFEVQLPHRVESAAKPLCTCEGPECPKVADMAGSKGRIEGREVRARFWTRWSIPLGMLLAVLGCQTPGAKPVPGEEAGGAVPFSGARAFSNLEALVAAGARGPGSDSAARAGDWIAEQLAGLGARVEVWREEPQGSDFEHAPVQAVVGFLEGESQDPVLLIARYDTLPGERDGLGPQDYAAGAGAAVVLELARVLAQSPRPYSVGLLFLEGDGLAGGTAMAELGPGEGPRRNFPGSHAAATELAARGMIERVRLAIFLGRLPGPGFILQRDLRSHRMYRETFWQTGRALDAGPMFAGTDVFSSPQAGHLAFLAAGLRPTVALIGAPRKSPGADFPGAAGAPDPAELATLGRVTLEAIQGISLRLSRIDAFSRSPLGQSEPGVGGTQPPGGATEAGREPVDASESVFHGP